MSSSQGRDLYNKQEAGATLKRHRLMKQGKKCLFKQCKHISRLVSNRRSSSIKLALLNGAAIGLGKTDDRITVCVHDVFIYAICGSLFSQSD